MFQIISTKINIYFNLLKWGVGIPFPDGMSEFRFRQNIDRVGTLIPDGMSETTFSVANSDSDKILTESELGHPE
jgi:hypothetical protein